MWRKLIETWERYPWRLTDLLQGSAEEQVEKAKEVCAKPPCCLDSFTAKLAKQYGPEVLAGEEAKVFLKAVFDRVLPTSTYVERMFARLARWTETKGHKLHLSQLSAKHFTNTFSSIVETWRGKARKSGIIARVRNNKERPSWVKGGWQQQCSTGLHIFPKIFWCRTRTPLVAKMRAARRGWLAPSGPGKCYQPKKDSTGSEWQRVRIETKEQLHPQSLT